MLELRGITKIYNPGEVTEMTLFENFNLTVGDGEFVSIVGSNGSGKTSMLNIICGSIPVERGQILISGKDVTKVPDSIFQFLCEAGNEEPYCRLYRYLPDQ